MKIQWLGKENCMDKFIQCYFVSKWFTRWFTFLIFVVFMNRNSMWHHVSSCRKWIITQITFVIHLIFMAFMNYVKCVSSNIMLEKMICHKSHNCNLLNFHLLWSQLSWVYFLLWKWLFCHIFLQIKYSKSLIIGMTGYRKKIPDYKNINGPVRTRG